MIIASGTICVCGHERMNHDANGRCSAGCECIVVTDPVSHPLHYGGDVPHETYKCLAAWGLESDALLWNAAKYISRAGKKGDKLEDLRKASWYLNLAIERAGRP